MTLLEVLIAVALVAFLMLILSAGVFQVFGSQVASTGMVEANRKERRAMEALLHGGRAQPDVEAVELEVELDARPFVDGWNARSALEARLDARITLTIEDPGTYRLRLPVVGSRIRDAKVEWRMGGGGLLGQSPWERTDAVWETDSLVVSVNAASAGPMEVRAIWTASAVDLLELPTDFGDQPFTLDAVVRGGPGVILQAAPGSPQPVFSQADPPLLRWTLSAQSAGQSLGVRVPADATPLGRTASLGKLAWLGMLLFGVCLWYLTELNEPGRLDSFRLGGVVLLAVDYCLFFVSVVVLGAGTSLPFGVAVAVSACLALPLLTFHIAHLTGRRFALLAAAPLAVVIWAGLVAWVALPQLGTLLAGAGFVLAVCVVTVSWQRFEEGRRRYEAERVEGEAARLRGAHRAKIREALMARVASVTALEAAGVHAVGEAPEGLATERGQVTRGLQRVSAALQAAREGVSQVEPLQRSDHQARVALLERVQGRLDSAEAVLEAALTRLDHAGTGAVEALGSALAAMGAAVDAAVLRGVEASDSAGEEVQGVLRALDALQHDRLALEGRVMAGTDVNRARAEARQLERRARGALSALERAWDRDLRGAGLHCPTCGAAHTTASRFCSACGECRPHEVACGCGHVMVLPDHLLHEAWLEQPLHCGVCGEASACAARSTPEWPAADPPRT